MHKQARNVLGILVWALFLLLPVAVGAQSVVGEQSVSFGFMLGAAPLMQGHDNTSGYALGVEALLPLPSPRLALRGDLMYRGGALQKACMVSVVQQAQAQAVANRCLGPDPMFAWSADLVVRLSDRPTRWSPYVLVGAALYTTPPGTSNNGERFPSRAGVQAGAGFEFRYSDHTAWFIEARYMDFSPARVVPVTVGVRF